ncbi:MAG: hypothetical protein WC549_00625 [Actinomycetota bacterium]
MILDRNIDVYRLSKDNNNTNKESYVKHDALSNTSINCQPASSEDTILAEGTFGQTYIAFTTASGILPGDKLVDTVTNEVFIVKGRTNWLSPDLIPHIELLVNKFETTE